MNSTDNLKMDTIGDSITVCYIWMDKSSLKVPKMVHFGKFVKPNDCSQTVLPDRYNLIGQIEKIKWDIL